MNFWNGIKCHLRAWLEDLADWASVKPGDATNVRPLVCLRTACTVTALGAIMTAHAGVSYTNSASAINATDFISWNRIGVDGTVVFNPTTGTTSGGMRFKAIKAGMGAMRLASESTGTGTELCLNTQNSNSVSIEFDKPVVAAGALLVNSNPSYSNVTVRAYDNAGAMILQTTETHVPGSSDPAQFMGAVGTGENIKKLEFSTDSGVLSLGHIDLRAFSAAGAGFPLDMAAAYNQALTANASPVVFDQLYTVLKNTSDVSPVPNVLLGSDNATDVKLVREPSHAAYFKLFPDGTFSYTPEKDYSGSDDFAFVGLDDSGQLQSNIGTARINVMWTNSAPAFRGGPDVISEEDSGPQSFLKWAQDASAGPSDEDAYQKLQWFVNNDNPQLFTEQPHVDSAGNLLYTSAPHLSGTAHITVWLKDDGGTANGGVDLSEPAHATITVTGVAHRPVIENLLDQTLTEGQTMEVQARGTSLDFGAPLTYALVDAPDGMTIDPLNGTIRWTPGKENAGKSYAVSVCAISESLSDAKVMIVNVRHAKPPTVVATLRNPAARKPEVMKRVAAIAIVGERPVRKLLQPQRHPRYWVE